MNGARARGIREARGLRRTLIATTIVASLSACGGGDGDGHDGSAARPNILYIMADDLGYSDIHAFGGEIDTPNLDALAAGGRLLLNHHAGTGCAITRAMLISGTDHHLVGEGTMGKPNDERAGLPGYEGYLNDRSLSVAQLLKDAGYHTYMAGKWHLGSGVAGSDGSSGLTPDQWGFEHSYALLGGAASNHFAHEAADSKNYTEDGRYVQPGQPGQPGGDGGTPAVFYSTDFYTQKLISYIDASHGDGKPFFAYAAYTSPHWPLQVPEPWLSKYKGRYDVGYGAIRAARIERQIGLGIIPASFNPFPGLPGTTARSPASASYGSPSAQYISAVHGPADGYVDYHQGNVDKEWNDLTPLERKAQARYMEIYAGMVNNLDHNIGLLIQHLKDIGEYDNTFIMFQSDNGAEGWPIDSGADPKTTDEANATSPLYETLGTDNGRTSARNLKYGLRWAEVSATPLSLTKGYSGEGGVGVPAIVRLPRQSKGGAAYDEFTHVTDDTATFLAIAGVQPPTTPAPSAIDPDTGVDANRGKVVYDGRNVYPVTGKSLLPVLQGKTTQAVHGEGFGDESYGRAYVLSPDGNWSATPLSLTKGYSGEGGVGVPAIVRLPRQSKGGAAYDEFTHVTDDTATFLAIAGVQPPTTPAPSAIDPDTGVDANRGKVVYDGRNVYPVTGKSLLPVLQGKTTQAVHGEGFGDESYGRAYVLSPDGNWKARWTEPPLGPADGHWQLYDIRRDRGEVEDVSAQHPDVVEQLVTQWSAYMTSVGGVEPLQPKGYY